MRFSDPCGISEAFAKDPAVVRLGNIYFLYYSIFMAEDDRNDCADRQVLHIGMATSTDLEHWERRGYLPHTQDCEQNGIGAPGAYVENGTVHLFYQTYGNGRLDAICHAISTDGLSFEKDVTNPIFRPTKDWCCGRAIDADVVPWGDKLYLYFATRDLAMKMQMVGCAVSPLGSSYGRETWTQMQSGPVLAPTLPWEGLCIEAPATLVIGDAVHMFYGGAYNCSPQQIGYAISRDGVHFERASDLPFLPNGISGSWNASESGHPYLFADIDGTLHLFYQGSPDGGRRWYLSRCTLCLTDGRLCVDTIYDSN